MKPFLFLLTLFGCLNCYSQALPLSLSVPQPRLGERFEVSFNADTLSNEIFSIDTNKFKVESYNTVGSIPTFTVSLKALKIGQNEVGPFKFSFNKKVFITTKLTFTVAVSLPDVKAGLWIRKLQINDSMVYIMIDQKQSAHTVVTQKTDNTINAKADVDGGESDASLNDDIENARVEEWGSNSLTMPDFIHNDNGYHKSYKCYRITILDKTKPLILKRQVFNNLPGNYQFKDIVIN